jgi:hypothetical protein
MDIIFFIKMVKKICEAQMLNFAEFFTIYADKL